MDGIDTYRLQDIVVAIVDDHEVVLEGLKKFLQEAGVGRLEAFSRGCDLLARIQAFRFDVIIVDVELADIEGSLLIDRIRELLPEARIIVHTMHEEAWVVNKMTEKHVDGLLYKADHLEQLTEAIVAVHAGRNYFSPKFRKLQREVMMQRSSLTDREVEVLLELARGYSTKEIARLLFISENTVENHRKNLFRKLQARNVANLIINAITAGYINPAEL